VGQKLFFLQGLPGVLRGWVEFGPRRFIPRHPDTGKTQSADKLIAMAHAREALRVQHLKRGAPRQEPELGKYVRPLVIRGPGGSLISKADLPPARTLRWVASRKAIVVAAVRGGLLTLSEACERYDLTVDEYLDWQRALDRNGVPGLRAMRVQHYRRAGG
jgi:hypothetical protein